MLEGGASEPRKMSENMSQSSWEAEGGAESEVNQSETRDQFFDNDNKKLEATRRDTEPM